LAELDPVRGSEANKIRPVVIVSNDHSNTAVRIHRRGVVTMVPLTSSVAKVYNFQVLLPAGEGGTDRDSKVQPEQIRALALERFKRRLGALDSERMWEVDEAIALHLGLN
jgi:mRNA interferase MazF